jgi:hypothetical protein
VRSVGNVPKTDLAVVAIVGSDLVGAATLRPYPSDGTLDGATKSGVVKAVRASGVSAAGQAYPGRVRKGLIEPMSVIPGYQRRGVETAIWNYVVSLAQKRLIPA